jgi:GNAT superfamily N-acetyltransferase
MPVVSQLAVCNQALDRIRAAPIATINENTMEAAKCARFYPLAVADMLDGPFDHDWSFANVRVALAQRPVNDREFEWLYAYAVPANMASAIRVIPDFEGAGLGYPVPLLGEPYAETWAVAGGFYETPYIIEAETLYSNVENALLEYAINDIAGLNVSQKVITALELDLAARLAFPVKADKEREKTLAQAAATAWERAIADDRNRQPQQSGQYLSEAMVARRGYIGD